MIRFNQPYITGNELKYIKDCMEEGRFSGNGKYTKLCHQFFENRYQIGKALLTTSCTDALEMSALLAEIQPGDEVIIPSYTFVSTANAFVLRGARIIFADSEPDFPNIDVTELEKLYTDKTKAIVVVHYAGAACDMDPIIKFAKEKDILVIEDAAQGIESTYKGKPLGSLGDLGAFSFHETKNIISGEGGLLAINNDRYKARAEIIWEKGTNRAAFYRGEVDKYTWVDQGSSYLPSELNAAFLYAQLEQIEKIQNRRLEIWQFYHDQLKSLEERGDIKLVKLKSYQSNNAHMFYILVEDITVRDRMLSFLKSNEILAVFHYLTLHDSPFYQDKHDGRMLPNAKHFADCLIRLPFYPDLTMQELEYISDHVQKFYQ